ncbi:hypothetical protein LRS10_11595 [Phenylobacterium sp. J426]|uniref:hypothetical protein n=1 Tax=Phenylobacterium sp. J426 TaxID=2898439 RepID=UPI002150D4AB|nr:hypothetical protein [Phenylobacterium sp. J426]MCR5874752.1 hypothetical protein [Phenylobacterium sp. J426]
MRTTLFAAAFVAVVALAPIGCASAFAGEPIQGATGKYMSPFTTDGTTSGWVTKSMQVRATGQVAGLAGQYAAQKALENVPFVGMFGKQIGEQAGRAVALQSIGGEEFLKSTSDLSFATAQDLADYVKAHHADHPEIGKVMEATYAIYPDVQQAWLMAKRPLAVGQALKATGPAPAAFDYYRISNVKAGQALSVTLECDTMEPTVSLTDAKGRKALGYVQAKKGEKTVTFDATAPADGEYLLMVTPTSRFMGGSPGGGVYTVTVAEKKL